MIKLGIYGPPGSGKGTLCGLLSKEYGISHIATGDIFRNIVNENSPLALKVKKQLLNGDYVSDETTIGIFSQYLNSLKTKKGFIIDGFPRTLKQAKWLLNTISLDCFIVLEVDYDTIRKRITGRRIHPNSDRVYHITFNPPKVENKDDVTGDDLVHRTDDTIEMVNHRLELYEKNSIPILNLIEKHIDCMHIDASKNKQETLQQCDEFIVEHFKRVKTDKLI